MTSRSTYHATTAPRGVRAARLGILLMVSMWTLAVVGLLADELPGSMDRSEAQSIADASALAGGRAFLQQDGEGAGAAAEAEALRYAMERLAQQGPVAASQIDVDVDAPERSVRVSIRRHQFGGRRQGLAAIGIGPQPVTALAAVAPVALGCQGDSGARCSSTNLALRLID